MVMTSACMMHFTGGVPQPLIDQTWNHTGGSQLIKHLDERFLNEELRIYGGNLAIGAQVIFQQKLVLSTSF
jgi:hypothetical protein